nr:reverse transcriptase domain-containing protein [Tanacetum cinerariifolium]
RYNAHLDERPFKEHAVSQLYRGYTDATTIFKRETYPKLPDQMKQTGIRSLKTANPCCNPNSKQSMFAALPRRPFPNLLRVMASLLENVLIAVPRQKTVHLASICVIDWIGWARLPSIVFIGADGYAYPSLCGLTLILVLQLVGPLGQTYELTNIIVDIFEYHFQGVTDWIYVRGVLLLCAFMCSRFGALVMSVIQKCKANTKMRTRSAGRPAAESLGGGTGVRVGRGGRGRRPREGNDERVSNQENVENQNGNVVNENVSENVRNVLVNGNRVGCSYKEFLACNPKEYDGKGGAVVLTRWIKKIENMQDMSGSSIDQKVKYTAGSFVGDMC